MIFFFCQQHLGLTDMEAQIRAILAKAGIQTPLDDDELQVIASSASSSGLSASSPGQSVVDHSHSIVGGASSADLSLASEVMRTLHSPHRLAAHQTPPPHGRAHPVGQSTPGLSDVLKRE